MLSQPFVFLHLSVDSNAVQRKNVNLLVQPQGMTFKKKQEAAYKAVKRSCDCMIYVESCSMGRFKTIQVNFAVNCRWYIICVKLKLLNLTCFTGLSAIIIQ